MEISGWSDKLVEHGNPNSELCNTGKQSKTIVVSDRDFARTTNEKGSLRSRNATGRGLIHEILRGQPVQKSWLNTSTTAVEAAYFTFSFTI